MSDKILVSTAYLPPVSYFSAISGYSEILVEKEENYIKQSFRNRCYILSANGPMFISVPVLLGSFHKTAIKDIRIDYSRRWQQVHIGALISSYRSSPFFQYYFDEIEQIISARRSFLLDLNQLLTEYLIRSIGIKGKSEFTASFQPSDNEPDDYRYLISPKINDTRKYKAYTQVFSSKFGFVPGLSVVDLLFNTGPDAGSYL
jgi:hypothetical protein